MQLSKDGHRNVEFGTVSEVQALINSILDANQQKQSNSQSLVLESEPFEKLNH